MINATDSKGTFYILNKKDRTPIIFIHGVGLDHSIWDPQINEFDNTVLIYDILGHGRTPLNKEKISFDDFSDQIIDLIDELKFDKIHLVGFSIGSLIARNFGTKFSDRLKSLTLLCSIFNRSDDEQKIVNERFEQTKKDKKLTKDALNRIQEQLCDTLHADFKNRLEVMFASGLCFHTDSSCEGQRAQHDKECLEIICRGPEPEGRPDGRYTSGMISALSLVKRFITRRSPGCQVNPLRRPVGSGPGKQGTDV